MYKDLLVNRRYKFALDGSYWLDGKLIRSDKNTMVEITIDGKPCQLNAGWLALIAHFEVMLSLVDLLKIKFVPCESKVIKMRCKHLMVFERPIEIAGGFRLIPGFTGFAVNNKAEVISLLRGKKLAERLNAYGYPAVAMYDADKGDWRQVQKHVLFARAFVDNDNPVLKIFVNHKDGNKQNVTISNLEWVTASENVRHAVASHLRFDNVECAVRDVVTKNITSYSSVSEAMEAIGYDRKPRPVNMLKDGIVVPQLFRNRYEVKLNKDNRDWYYDEIPPVESRKRHHWNIIQAKNLETGQVIESAIIEDITRSTGVNRNTIRKALVSVDVIAHEGYLFRHKTDKDWATSWITARKYLKYSVQLTNMETNEVLTFGSVAKVAAFLGVDKLTIGNRVKKGGLFRHWKIVVNKPENSPRE